MVDGLPRASSFLWLASFMVARFEFFMKNAADSCLRFLKIRLFDVGNVASKFAILKCCSVLMCQRIPSLQHLFFVIVHALSMCESYWLVCVFRFAVVCCIAFANVCPQLWLELFFLSPFSCASAWRALLLLLHVPSNLKPARRR